MSKKIILKSGASFCEILPGRGALTSKLCLNGQDLLWLPSDFSDTDSSWPGGGLPICFPFAGRVWHDGMLYRYCVDGTPHHMPLHGFGFASEFGVKSVTANSASLVLRETTASQVLFPFMFELNVNFKLEANSFEISTEIIHTSPTNRQKKHPMPIAMGWHPYLNVHNADSASVSLPSSMYYSVTQSGAAGKSALVSEFGPPPWSIKKPLLNSLIFSDLDPSKEACFNSGKNPEKNIKLAFGPPKIFNHIVVWSNNLEEFYCVEPWMSLPDAVSTPSGCLWLMPEDSLKNWIRISI